MKLIATIPFILCIIFETLQQLSYSQAGKNSNTKIKFLTLGVGCYFMMLVTWYWLLNLLPLGVATPLMGASYITVALGSKLFFKEQITLVHWVGIIAIITGLGVISISQ